MSKVEKKLLWKGLLTKGSSGRNNFLVLSDLNL